MKHDTPKLALFEETIAPHLDAAYNLARWLTRNDQDAEDVVQEASLRAFRYFDGFKGGDGKAWLLAVVRNTCMTWNRRWKGPAAMVAFDERTHGRDRAEVDAESKLLQEAELVSLRDCLETLAPEYREVLVLRELEELCYKDIAEIVGVPMGTVMSRLSRGRSRLADCITARVKGANT